MPRADYGQVSVTTTTVVLVVVVGSLLGPAATSAVADLTGGTDAPLQVGSAEISLDLSLVKSDFQAGTYHFTAIQIQLSNVVGRGTLLIQIGIPDLNSYVLTMRSEIDSPQPNDRTVSYQPSVEFHPTRIDESVYPAQLTVRIQSNEGSQILAETTVKIRVKQ